MRCILNTNKKKLIKIRIQIKNEFYIGPGKILLLEKIGEKGSISKAAESIGLSYKKAWKLIDELNRYSSKKLVYAKPGGKGVRGSQLTNEGKTFIKIFRNIESKLTKLTIKENKDLESFFSDI